MEKKIQEKILKAIPGIKKIGDPRLQGQALKLWARAIKEGCFKNLEDIPFSVDIPEAKLVDHIQWVLDAALGIAHLVEKKMDLLVDRDLLVASVLLHDLGKAFEYQKKGSRYVKSVIGKKFMHGLWGTYIALEEGVSPDLAHLISTHGKDSPIHPQLIEGVILHYADFAHADILRFRKGLSTFLSLK